MASSCLIPGPALLGFAMAFDECYGKATRGPLPVIAPASIGGVLLPFECIHCGEVRAEVVGAQAAQFKDATRGHSWCPACRGRYLLDMRGAPLAINLGAGARGAPATINGRQPVTALHSGMDLLGLK